jgi:hypothetical protein
MRPLIIALLITIAVILAVMLLGAPTGFATYKFDKLTVSGGHALLTQTFSPNGDGVADYVSVYASGKCGNGKNAVVGIKSTTGACDAAHMGSFIKSAPSTWTCYQTSCEFSGPFTWDGTDPKNNNALQPDGTYCIQSGCYAPSGASGVDGASADKIVTITLNRKAYPAKSTYVNGVVCGSKPTCKGSKTLNMMSGCDKTPTQNAGNRCNGKDDTCLKQDTGSCRFNGVTCLYDSNYCCKPVTGNGVCQATTVAAVPK